MPNDPMLSIDSLHTVSGASLAVLLIVQIIKSLPLIHWLPTKWLAIGVGEALVFMTSPPPADAAGCIVLLLNGIQAGFAAIGGYQIFSVGARQSRLREPAEDGEKCQDMDRRGA